MVLFTLTCFLGAAMLLTLPERTGPATDPAGRPTATCPGTEVQADPHVLAPAGTVTVGLRSGVRALLGQPTLAAVTLASSIAQLGLGALPVIAVVLTSRAGAPHAAAWLLSANALGALLGSLVWTWRPAPPSRGARWCLLSLLGIGVPLALTAAVPTPACATVSFAVSGICTGPFTGALFTTRDRHAPPGTRAQVFTLGAGIEVSSAAAGAAVVAAAAGAALRLRHCQSHLRS